MHSLPIDPHLPQIISALRSSNALVLTAPPGAGKTTRVPRAVYEAGFSDQGEILILEPRRLAARLAASRVAQELNEKLGETVGYSIRFEAVGGPKTRIKFLTEAILSRRMVHDPNLNGVSAVILDEFHERHLTTDLALSFLKQLQKTNDRLKLVVMSATMNAEPVLSFLPNAVSLSVGESPFSLDIQYEDRISDRPLHEKVASAIFRLVSSGLEGDILVFLPGASEIRRSAEALQPLADRSGFLLHTLHGDLPLSVQKRAIEPAARPKVILATNVAETSITIPGIAAVVDSGLARVVNHSPWSGFPTLTTAKISKSSALQRAGRAGRTQAGRIVRLYTRFDFESRSEYEIPEIKRSDLTETALLLHASGVQNVEAFGWFEAPPASAIEAADTLLVKLGAIDEKGQLSAIGMRMLKLPAHPRLARLMVEGEKLHITEESALLAALLAEKDIRLDSRTQLDKPPGRPPQHVSGRSDLLELMDRFREAESVRFESSRVLDLGLDAGAIQAVLRAQRQLLKILSKAHPMRSSESIEGKIEDALLMAVLTAFPDRVAKRRKTGSRQLLLAGGGSATLSPASVVHEPMLVVAVDVEDRKERSLPKLSSPMIRYASAIEMEWLAGLFPGSICQNTDLVWNEKAGRVEEVRRTTYSQLVLEETIRTADPGKETSRLLAAKVLERNVLPFRDAPSVASLQARVHLLSECFPKEGWLDLSESQIRAAVEMLCSGKRALAEIESLSLINALVDGLTNNQRALLRREVPDHIKLNSGRNVRIHYEPRKLPWIESRLQDFFGIDSTPTICGGRIPLTIHLLAPNGRAVQVTRDLTGFWQKHYPSVRRELQRRYPKHSWPDPRSLKNS